MTRPVTGADWTLSGASVLAPWRERALSPVPAQREQLGPTKSELLLWSALDDAQVGWVREYSTGRYRLDFFLPSLQLAVEVDGSSHHGALAQAHDDVRDEWHLARGIETMRISAHHVERDLDGVLAEIAQRMALLACPAKVTSPMRLLTDSGEVVVEASPAVGVDLSTAFEGAEAEIESFVTGVACLAVLPEVSSGWGRLAARVRGR